MQDVAITLYYGREQENAKALQAAFKEGYSSLRTWPLESDEQLHTLIAARTAMFANYVAHSLPADGAKEYLDKWCAELEQYLNQYG